TVGWNDIRLMGSILAGAPLWGNAPLRCGSLLFQEGARAARPQALTSPQKRSASGSLACTHADHDTPTSRKRDGACRVRRTCLRASRPPSFLFAASVHTRQGSERAANPQQRSRRSPTAATRSGANRSDAQRSDAQRSEPQRSEQRTSEASAKSA